MLGAGISPGNFLPPNQPLDARKGRSIVGYATEEFDPLYNGFAIFLPNASPTPRWARFPAGHAVPRFRSVTFLHDTLSRTFQTSDFCRTRCPALSGASGFCRTSCPALSGRHVSARHAVPHFPDVRFLQDALSRGFRASDSCRTRCPAVSGRRISAGHAVPQFPDVGFLQDTLSRTFRSVTPGECRDARERSESAAGAKAKDYGRQRRAEPRAGLESAAIRPRAELSSARSPSRSAGSRGRNRRGSRRPRHRGQYAAARRDCP
jgi:hypothetical protein